MTQPCTPVKKGAGWYVFTQDEPQYVHVFMDRFPSWEAAFVSGAAREWWRAQHRADRLWKRLEKM